VGFPKSWFLFLLFWDAKWVGVGMGLDLGFFFFSQVSKNNTFTKSKVYCCCCFKKTKAFIWVLIGLKRKRGKRKGVKRAHSSLGCMD